MLRRILLPTTRQYVRFISYNPQKLVTYPTNHQIPFQRVHVVGSTGPDEPPIPLSDLLSSIDKSTHLVRLVSHEPPTVQVLTHLEDQLAKLERKAEQKAKKNRGGNIVSKELRFTWLTSDADYEHKVAAALKDLERGGTRVAIAFSSKRGVRAPTKMEMNEQINKVLAAFQSVSCEWKQRTVERGVAKVYLESTVKKSAKVLPTKEELEEQAKRIMEKRERGIKRNSD